MSEIKVKRLKKLQARFQVSGDKSISHRSAILAGFASGKTKVTGFLNSEDCLNTLHAMQALGVETETLSETSFVITGRSGKFLAPGESLDCGNSGTSIRLLAGLLAGQPFDTRLFGDASLSKRPMKRIVEPLQLMGGKITCEGADLRPPITVHGTALKGITYQTPIPSAQLKSALLLAGLQAEGKTVVKESIQSRDHTERMLKHFHASMHQEGTEVSVYGGHTLHAQDIQVPGDISSAAFWLVAAAAFPKSRITLPCVGLNPTRTGLLNVLMRMGAQITETVESNGVEPYGTLSINEGGALKATTVGGKEIPNVIDELPILAVAFALAEGTSVIKDATELRVKETDRIAALAVNLRAFGVEVEETPDGLIVHGGKPIKAATVESFGDHRIAMAFIILGLFAEGTTVVKGTECIATSYPLFEKHLNMVIRGEMEKTTTGVI